MAKKRRTTAKKRSLKLPKKKFKSTSAAFKKGVRVGLAIARH